MSSSVEAQEIIFSSLLALAVVVQWVFFALGGVRLLGRLRLAESSEPLASTAARALLLILALCMVLGAFGMPSLYLGALLVWGATFAGALHAWRSRGAWIGRMGPRRHALGLAGILGFVMIFWWASILVELPGLPTHHDGIAHTAFLMRTLDSANPFLHKSLLEFADEFGRSLFNYYPNGVHAIVTMFGGPLLWLKVCLPAPLLKAWMIAACASTPLIAGWITRRLFPFAPVWIAFTVAVLAATFFQFPVWGADSGGFSRLVAQVLYLPVMTYLVTNDTWGRRKKELATHLLVLPVVLFHVHPAILGLHLFTLAACFVWRLRRLPGKELALWLAFGTLGIGLVGVLIWSSASVDVIAHADAAPKSLPFSYDALWERWKAYLRILATQGYTPRFQVSLRTLLGVVGFVALPCWRDRGIGGTRSIYPLVSQLFALVTLTFVYSSGILLNAGHIYYNDMGRLAEVAFFAQVSCWAAAVILVRKIALTVASKFPKRAGKLFLGVGTAYFSAWLAVDTSTYSNFNRRHLKHFFREYGSPVFGDSEDLARTIRRSTESDAVLVYAPGTLESMEGRTGRRGLFMYAECPYGQKTENCDKRIAFYAPIEKSLLAAFKGPSPEAPCIDAMKVFDGRPVYFFLKKEDLKPGPLRFPSTICRDATLLSEDNGFVMGRYDAP